MTSAIGAQRMKQMVLAEEIKLSFLVGVPVFLHWNGKMFPDLTGRLNVERLSIPICGENCSKFVQFQN